VALPLIAGGCVYQQTIQKSGTDYLPMVVDAEAWCHAEPGHGAIFSVSATVDDDDGLRDVEGVEANVYDEYGDRQHVARLPLDPTDDPAVWAADYRSGGGLDCQYNGYTVDFVAWDDIVYSDVLTVWAEALPTAD
jgi:hypothetical protein